MYYIQNKKQEELDIRILNNELPKENFNLVKYRNQIYEDKLYSMIIESGENTKKLENIYFMRA